MWRHGKWNAECPVLLLGNEYATPQNRFFIRSHGPVPRDLDAKTHRVEICGLVDKPSSFTITEMKAKFPVCELWSALVRPLNLHARTSARVDDCLQVCSGSRRNELNLIKHGGGHIDWHSSVANAKWTGVCAHAYWCMLQGSEVPLLNVGVPPRCVAALRCLTGLQRGQKC